jgi:hypothetical protein
VSGRHEVRARRERTTVISPQGHESRGPRTAGVLRSARATALSLVPHSPQHDAAAHQQK